MVVRLMRWPWPTASSKKYAVNLIVRGIDFFVVDKEPEAGLRMKAEVRWKGKVGVFSSLMSVKRNCTREEMVIRDKGELEWNEEFESVAVLTENKDNTFNPWVIEIAVFSGMKQGTKKKPSIYGITSFNLAEFASSIGEQFELSLPLLLSGNSESHPPILHLSLKLLDSATSSPQPIEIIQTTATSPSSDNDEQPASKGRFIEVVKKLVPSGKVRKALHDIEVSDGRHSVRSEESCCTCANDTDSIDDDSPNDELDWYKDDATIQKSISYGTLKDERSAAHMDVDHECLIYYSHKRTDVSSSHVGEATPSINGKSPKRRILPWRKRKHSFNSPKAKGEPLLKKAYGDNGGDDIDYDRRLLSSSDESLSGKYSFESLFGDDNFAVGCWELKEITSRCGHLKLSTEVFFASIDQRNERAAGESACTALVAVVADWFHMNPDIMPIKSQLDSLIREGSLEWRNLCENETYRARFPDKHFDLETVIQAKVRPLSVVPEKSFIGFFHPEGCEINNGFEFLHGAMSFDDIWHEISLAESDSLFIVSWNDHFFLLKVEQDAYFIIDTLGERLYEGCNQAYILKFDKNSNIHGIPNTKEIAAANVRGSKCAAPAEEPPPELICEGKESCKEYIKSFLAAIPISELLVDIKKGLTDSTPLYQRLQIEFHYTNASSSLPTPPTFVPMQST